jgi:GDPmannose 4,6-dehydratase
MKTALVMGVNGQDGSYLADFLLARGYSVVGWVPEDIPVSLENIQDIQEKIELVRGKFSDQQGIINLLDETQPDEVYNLASPSSPSASWEDIVYKSDVTALGTARLLEGIRNVVPSAKFYQASTSEMFGNADRAPQNEETPFHPRNPYGMAKLHAYWLTRNYREHYGLFAVSGIMFNHESPRRGTQYVTRKITQTAARIKMGLTDQLRLGNLDARRDWGFAPDYVRAMWLMINRDQPDDFVIGTGQTHSVREFCRETFSLINLDYRDYLIQDPSLFHPAEDIPLVADPSKAEENLGWTPEHTFQDIVKIMVQADLERQGDARKTLE